MGELHNSILSARSYQTATANVVFAMSQGPPSPRLQGNREPPPLVDRNLGVMVNY